MAISFSLRCSLLMACAVSAILGILATLYLTRSKEYDVDDHFISRLESKSRFLIGLEKRKPVALLPEKIRKNKGFIVDTPGCRIAKFDPFDVSVAKLYKSQGEYPCPGPPMFMFSQPNGSITIDESILDQHYKLRSDNISCTYQAIRRKYEKRGDVRENAYGWMKPRELRFGVPLHEDYVYVECVLGNKSFDHYFPLIRLKKSIERKKVRISPPTPHLNMILAGIDSISKLNFLRHFKKTQNFMKQKGHFFDMKGYTKVGDNSFSNLTPLLAGRFVQDIWNKTLKDTMYFDDVDFIWKRYSQKGYRTFFAEDSPLWGTFNHEKRGFNETPTDYYIRPLYLAMQYSKLRQKGPWLCFNSVIETDVIYNYLVDFAKGMGTRPYFAFAMVSALTHNYLNFAGHADYPTARLLDNLWQAGALNNSVLVLFGDHGLRFGKIRSTHIGKYEERMPFLYIRFPPWFLKQFPRIERHLRDNQERLVTLFDVHATMLHLLDVNKELSMEERTHLTLYGKSLMGDISPRRTCDEASVLLTWCCCHVFRPVSAFQSEVARSVDAILMHVIANQMDPSPVLGAEDVISAKMGRLNDLALRFVKHDGDVGGHAVYEDEIVRYEDFVVTVKTRPGGSLFEGTVRHDIVEDSYQVVDVFKMDVCCT